MDYQSIHGQDISSFDLTSTHRLPTVSAAQALEELGSDPRRFILTGLKALDRALNDAPVDGSVPSPRPGGLQKGQVVEVWGPPGSGKTTLGMQLASNALRDGSKVVWVDAFHPVCRERFREVIGSARIPSSSLSSSTAANSVATKFENILHFTTPTLAHLIGLLCRPTTTSIPKDTSLIVVDGLSGLVNHAFPKNLEPRQTSKGPGPAARRSQTLQYVMSTLQKLSATRDIIVLVLSQCATRMQSERGATLVPSINAGTWDQGIATRLVLFRDWMVKSDMVHDMHFVGIQKQNSKASADGMGPVLAFDIVRDGFVGIEADSSQPPLTLTSTPHQKRKLDQTDFEIADSEGEDYGWEDEDEAEMPPLPSQWQGSEDLLLGQTEDNDNRTDESPDIQPPYEDEHVAQVD